MATIIWKDLKIVQYAYLLKAAQIQHIDNNIFIRLVSSGWEFKQKNRKSNHLDANYTLHWKYEKYSRCKKKDL